MKKLSSPQKKKKLNRTFCKKLFHKKNLLRDTVLIAIVIFLSAIVIVGANYSRNISSQKTQHLLSGDNFLSEEDVYQEVKNIQATVDKSDWKKYQSKWYGFEVEYPNGWILPKNLAASSNSKWEYAFQFRKEIATESDSSPYIGFDVLVYNLNRTKGLKETAEFPQAKTSDLETEEATCGTIEGHIIETGDYSAEEIYIPPMDDCYEPALFFSFTRGNYLYNIVPVLQKEFLQTGDPRVEISDNFPEFYMAISTLNPIDIVRPTLAPSNPKTTAPYPVSYKVVNGKLVCAKKNDKPSKSNKNKKKHLDMECCLDPDEYPNPHCYYDPAKYGKYLK